MKNIEENNKLIAEFMGYEKEKNDKYFKYEYSYYIYILEGTQLYSVQRLKFHKSLDWLVPVMKKVLSLAWKLGQRGGEYVYKARALEKIILTFDIDLIYPELVGFIKWYNKNKEE